MEPTATEERTWSQWLSDSTPSFLKSSTPASESASATDTSVGDGGVGGRRRKGKKSKKTRRTTKRSRSGRKSSRL